MGNHVKNRLLARFMAAAMLLLLLILVNLTVYALTRSQSEKILAEAPALAPLLADQNRIVLFLVGLVSLVYFAGVLLASFIPERRRAVIAPPCEVAESGPLDGLEEELDRIWAPHEVGQTIQEPDRPVPPL
jgi:hypothetical protein